MKLVVFSPYPLKSGIFSAYMQGYLAEYRRLGMTVEHHKMYFWEDKLRYSLAWLRFLPRLLDREAVFVLHQHTLPASGPLAPLFLAAARLLGRRTVVVSHETMETYAKHLSGAGKGLVYGYEKRMMRLCTHYVVHTRLHRQELEGLGTGRPIQVIPHPVPTVPEANRIQAGERKAWGFYGMVAKKKGLDLFLSAYLAHPPRTLPPLRIMGTFAPGEEAHLQGLKESIPSSHRSFITFTGYLKEEDKPALFGDLALMVFPYRWISQSGALAEACMYRIPYLASNLPYFREFRDEFGCGELFDLEHPESLEPLLLRIASEPLNPPASDFDALEERLSFPRCAARMQALFLSSSPLPPSSGLSGPRP